jgi:hypothetical protein
MVEIHKLQEIMHLRNHEYKTMLLLCLHNTRITNYIPLAIRKTTLFTLLLLLFCESYRKPFCKALKQLQRKWEACSGLIKPALFFHQQFLIIFKKRSTCEN